MILQRSLSSQAFVWYLISPIRSFYVLSTAHNHQWESLLKRNRFPLFPFVQPMEFWTLPLLPLSFTSPSSKALFLSSFLQPYTLFPCSPLLLLNWISFHANKNGLNSWGCRRVVVGRQEGCHAFTSFWCPPSLRQHVCSLKKGHTVVSIHLSWLNPKSDFSHVHTPVRVPEVDSRCHFFFQPLPEPVKMDWWKTPLLHFSNSTSMRALSVWADVVCCSLCRVFPPRLQLPERDKWQNHVRLVMQRG